MSREIKFRGKSIMNNTCGDWLYSSGIKYGDDVELMYCDEDTSEEWNYIDKETVGQYTGLHDKNGKEIYEGDIIHINDEFLNEFNYLIEWNEEYLRYYLYSVDKEKLNKLGGILEAHLNSLEVEVIGNIYDNPELLGGE